MLLRRVLTELVLLATTSGAAAATVRTPLVPPPPHPDQTAALEGLRFGAPSVLRAGDAYGVTRMTVASLNDILWSAANTVSAATDRLPPDSHGCLTQTVAANRPWPRSPSAAWASRAGARRRRGWSRS
eukprot:COSAG04_NODE_5384_length_1634_cov_2.297068_3_plen_128_part_00